MHVRGRLGREIHRRRRERAPEKIGTRVCEKKSTKKGSKSNLPQQKTTAKNNQNSFVLTVHEQNALSGAVDVRLGVLGACNDGRVLQGPYFEHVVHPARHKPRPVRMDVLRRD